MATRVLFLLIVLSFVHHNLKAQAPANDACGGAIPINVNADCTPTAGTLYFTNTTSPNITGSCANGRRDVWYRFTQPANSTNATITVSLTSPTTLLTTGNVTIELFNASTCTLNSTTLGCGNISVPRTYTNLVPNNQYIFRITTNQVTTANPANWNFNVCVTSNDAIAHAGTIVPGNSRDANLWGASNEATAPIDCATGNPDDDVWYKFTAAYNYAVITLSNIGTSLASSGAMMQLYSGTPGALTSMGCTSTGIFNPITGLTPGSTYHIRVYSAGTGQTGFDHAGGQFRIAVAPSAPVIVGAGRMKEIYRQTILSSVGTLADPWEVTYGPDNKLWITESKGYRLYKIDPVTGIRDTVLDISLNSTFLPPSDQTFNVQFNNGNGAQGGFAGMALHPKFLDPVDPQNYVYISYIHTAVPGGGEPNGIFFINRLARFTYDPGTGKCGSPVSLCDTLPGSNDHNSQRIIIVPVGATHYLFYASGDMGSGQFSNRMRPNKAQDSTSYEGKILRFNLETDGEAGLDGWIPNNNPYNDDLGVQSAVWVTGVRNNQGFAYDPVLNILYGSSHGPYSDDEINIIQEKKNYGHPLVIGYAADNNYSGSTAGAALPPPANGISTCPTITDEPAAAAAIGNYKDPLFSAYAQPQAVINNIWSTNPGNGGWPSEGWSGMDLYTQTLVPGWHKSLVASSLKWGRLVRIRLRPTGDTVRAIGATDTASYFGSTNRFRDLAIRQGGKEIYVVMDRSATTSGPSAANPVIPGCGGCVQKYSFVGYADVGGKSTLPVDIDITAGNPNNVATATTVTIDADNSNYWVPITGPDGDIMAEIYANGQTLGEVTSAFYKNTNVVRGSGNIRYLDRNITINAQFPPVTPIKVRFYITTAEFNRLDAEGASQINTLTDLRIHRNNDPCGPLMLGPTTMTVPDYWDAFDTKGYVLQSDNITALSSFYFGAGNITLPLNLITFTGQYKNGSSHLRWETSSETNTDHFIVERSLPNGNFEPIGKVVAKGGVDKKAIYNYEDDQAAALGAPFILYRLKMVGRDNEFTYSNVVTINIPDVLITTINIFPNPANNETIVSINSPRDQRISWKLIDNAGRTVLSSNGQIRKGTNKVTLDLGKVPAGSYFLQVKGHYVNSIEKLQKL